MNPQHRPLRFVQKGAYQHNKVQFFHEPLVGGIPTPLKNMSSSVGMMKFPIYGKTCSKLPTRPLKINHATPLDFGDAPCLDKPHRSEETQTCPKAFSSCCRTSTWHPFFGSMGPTPIPPFQQDLKNTHLRFQWAFWNGWSILKPTFIVHLPSPTGLQAPLVSLQL